MAAELAVPNTLADQLTENTAATKVAAPTPKRPLSKGLGLQDNRPPETTANSQETRNTPPTTSINNCLLNSRTLVVQGRKKSGIKNVAAISVQRMTDRYIEISVYRNWVAGKIASSLSATASANSLFRYVDIGSRLLSTLKSMLIPQF